MFLFHRYTPAIDNTFVYDRVFSMESTQKEAELHNAVVCCYDEECQKHQSTWFAHGNCLRKPFLFSIRLMYVQISLQVYDYAAKPIINGVLTPELFMCCANLQSLFLQQQARLRGFNGTVFAYGLGP